MCLVCLMYLTLFAIHTAYLLSNIIRGLCSVNKLKSLFRNELFITLKCARSVHAVYASLYSLSEISLETGPGTCKQ